MKKLFTQIVAKSNIFALLLLTAIVGIAQPVNDDCTNAITITPGTTCSFTTYTNAAATYSTNTPLPACASYTTSAQDVWFKVTVPAGGALLFDTQAGVITDGGMAIYYGTCGALTLIECDDDDGAGLMPMISRTGLTPGATVYIRFWEYGGGTQGTFGLCVSIPPTAPPCATNPAAGDYCSSPTSICNLNGYCGNTSSSYTPDIPGNLGSVFCGSIENNSWLSFVADATTATLNLFVSNCSYGYGIQMQIYSVSSCATFTAVSNCFNPGTATNGSVTATGLTIGQTYYIMIDGNAGDVCNYIISASSGVFTVDAGPDVTICGGQTTVLNASGGTTYTWSPTTGLSNPNIANPIASPTTTTTYTLTTTGGNPLCPGSYTDQVTITVSSLAPTASNNGSICAGQTLNLSATPAGATAYAWSGPNGFTSTAQNPTIFGASALASGTYTVTVTNNGCTGTASTTAVVNSGATITATASPSAICVGNSSTIAASGASTYLWNTSSTSASFGVSPASTTTYTVTGTTASGCTGTTSVVLTVNPLPILSVSASPSAICVGQSTTFTASGANTYTWNTGNTGSTLTLSPPSSTSYTVTGTSSAGCTRTASVSITVNPLPTVTASASPSVVCAGQGTTLSATGASTYSWSSGNTGSSVSTIPATTTTYIVTGTSAAGCTRTASTTVTVNSLPNVAVAASATSICNGNSSILTASGASTYVWSTGGTSSFITVAPTTTTTYAVTGTSSSGCTQTSSITITVNPNPTLTALASPTAICIGASTNISVSGASTYSWSNGNSNSSFSISPSSTTTYSVTGTSGAGCTGTGSVTVVVNPLPNIVTSASLSSICTGASTTLTASGANSYSWSNGSSGASVSVTPGSSTTYTVTGTSVAGCTRTSSINITVNPLPVVSATASPAAICIGQSTTITGSGATSYAWNTGGIGNSIVQNPSSTTTYIVTGTSTAGCTATANAIVTVNPLPNISVLASPATICAGQNTTLTASGATTYSWNNGSSGAAISQNPSSSTTYSVTGTSSTGCTATASASVVVNPIPIVTASSTIGSLCAGESTTLNASGAAGYVWSSGQTTNSFTISPSNTTTYTVTGTSLGCSSTANTSVVVNPLPVVTATATPSVICVGFSSTISASGASSYNWSNGNSSSSFSELPVSSTSYVVTGTNLAGCTATATTSITVLQGLPVSISPSSPQLCEGDNIYLSASSTGTGVTFLWSSGQNCGFINESPTTTTTYSVTGTDVLGCSGTADAIVSVNPLPEINFSGNPLTGCLPLAVEFTDESNGNIAFRDWNFGDGSGSAAQNPSHTYTTPGSFNVTLIATTDAGCVDSLTRSSYITAMQIPVASFVANPPVATEDNPTILFTNNSIGATEWFWEFGDGGSSSSVQNPSYTYPGAGEYLVTLYVSNQAGCNNSTTGYITIKPTYTFYMANSFSPNGDNKNEIFRPFGMGWNTDYFEMRIYNRWGELMFVSTDINVGWDGIPMSGGIAPEGIYTVKVSIKDLDEKVHQYMQFLNVIR